MEWEQLEYFQTLAREQHVTRAAQIISITQPALSRSIARLEGQIARHFLIAKAEQLN